MCGRTACTLAPDEICKACSSSTINPESGKQTFMTPEWKDHPGTHQYSPSYNVAPSSFTPVMISSCHVKGVKRNIEDENVGKKYVIQPMMWGLIPFYHKGLSSTGHGLKTNNCRIETVLEKKLFSSSLKQGRRCVVLCDGFYEWQSIKGEKTKQPYLIYSPQLENAQVWDHNTWKDNTLWDEDKGWIGPKLLKIAGLFSCWTSEDGDEVMSYTVLTMESGEKFSAIHHRIPCILETERDVESWLNYKSVNFTEALKICRNNPQISWHPVGSGVNNSRNKDSVCALPTSLEKKPETGCKLMSAWLKSGKKNPSIKQEPSKDSKNIGISILLKKENAKDDSADLDIKIKSEDEESSK